MKALYPTLLLILSSTALAAPDVLEDQCWEETLVDEFDTLSLRNAENPDGRWITKYVWDRSLIVNNEQQMYIDPVEHGFSPFSVSDGILTIEAQPVPETLREHVGEQRYVSGLLNTGQKFDNSSFSQKYGRFEVRMKVPAGQGLWPAFWLLPAFAEWPPGGGPLPEIDIFEYLGHDTSTWYTSLHSTEGAEPGGLVSDSGTQKPGVDISRNFHLYSLTWNEDTIDWYFDRRKVYSKPTPGDLIWPMHIILNLAVGGNWPGNPDPSTPFPAQLEVDYVRAWQARQDCTP